MNLLLCFSFAGSGLKTIRDILRDGFATGNWESEKVSRVIGLGPKETTTNYTSLIDSLCGSKLKQDRRIDGPYRVFIEVIFRFSPPDVHGFLRIRKTTNEKKSHMNQLIRSQMCKAEVLCHAVQLLDHTRRVKKIDSLCKLVLNEMIVSIFSPLDGTLSYALRGFLRIGEMNQKGACVTYNTLISQMCKAEKPNHAVQLLDHMRSVKGLTPNKITYTSLIHSLCKQGGSIHKAYTVLNEMIDSGFSPSSVTLNDVLRGFLRIGDIRNAYEMRNEINGHNWGPLMEKDTFSSFLQALSDEVSYSKLMNAYLDEGKLSDVDYLHYEMEHFDAFLYEMEDFSSLPSYSVIHSVFINGLDNKVRTTETNKYLLRFNYDLPLDFTKTLEYHRTLAVNCSDDEFKSLVELVEGFCNRGLENAYDTMLEFNYKPDGMVYNLFIIEHCKCKNADKAYNTYTEMVRYGFACHMFTVFALIKTLNRQNMIDELLRVIQNVLRSCNLNNSEIVQFLNEFNPKKPDSEALFNVLAEKVKDGLFLKCSYVC